MRPNLQFPADLVKFTEEILNWKLHFLCSDTALSITFSRLIIPNDDVQKFVLFQNTKKVTDKQSFYQILSRRKIFLIVFVPSIMKTAHLLHYIKYRKLCAFTKFSRKEVRWSYVILYSAKNEVRL